MFELQGTNYKVSVSSILIDRDGENVEAHRAWLRDNTAFIFLNAGA